MNSPATGPTGSHDWKSDYIQENLKERTAYLDRVASSGLMQQVANATLALLALKPGDRVVDVGCGSGALIPRLCAEVGKAGHVLGIDYAEGFVREARARIEASGLSDVATVELGDASSLKLPPSSFNAAHCERLLMHLVDPDLAIREMVRVVRPGGVVVAAEPDWPGVRFDHPDQEAFTMVFRSSVTAQTADAGLTLYRRFGEAGLVDRRCIPISVAVTDIAQSRVFGLRLEAGVEALLAKGVMQPERLKAVVPALEAQSAAGNYYSVATMHVVAGTVPRRGES
jgi:ubiquinone/menaquinone biosynthesis C-methylase UbiE